MRILPVLLAVTSSLCAQSNYRRHNFTADVGAALPRSELRDLFASSAAAGFGYGFRFHPFFQADAGFQAVFGAARINDFLPTEFGQLRIRDYQFFFPFGGRVIVPISRDRVQFYAGGGGAYLRYTERLHQPFADQGFRFPCDVCAFRSGIGYYGLVGVNAALDRDQHFRVGVGSRVYRGHTEGDSFGDVPERRTNDNWIHVFVSFGVSF